MRASFEVDQSIALVASGAYYDLHNCFDFVGYEYQPTARVARFSWERTDGPWVPDDLPQELSLVFEEVSNLAVRMRDDEKPYSEDDCVEAISFLPREQAHDFDSICPDHRSLDEHFMILFESDACVKIWATRVFLEIKEPNRVAGGN